MLLVSVFFITASDVCTIECNDQFYCSNNFCKPHCARFRNYSKEVNVAVDVMIIIGAIVGLLGGIAVLIISVMKRKRMYVCIIAIYACTSSFYNIFLFAITLCRLKFPTIFIFYLTIALLIGGECNITSIYIYNYSRNE